MVKALVLAAVICIPVLTVAQTPAPDKCDGYLSAAFARRFVGDWIAAWNSHDMARVLASYDYDFEMSSPFIITAPNGDRSGTLKGKSRVATYWQKGLSSQNFRLIDVFAGAHSIAIHYERLNAKPGSSTRIATEIEEFSPDCKVVRSNALYGGS